MNVLSSIHNIITNIQSNQQQIEYDDPTSTPEIEQIYTSALVYFKFNGTTTNLGTQTGTSGTFTTSGQLNVYTNDKTQTKGLYLRYGQNTSAKSNIRPFFSPSMLEMTFSVNYYPFDAVGDTATSTLRRSPIYVKTQTSPDLGNAGRFGVLILSGTQISILLNGSNIQVPTNFPIKYNKWNNIILTYVKQSSPNKCIGTMYIKNNEVSYSTTFEITDTTAINNLSIDSVSNTGILLGREQFNGNIDCPGYYIKLAFWNRILTNTEITSIQNEFTT